MQKQQKIIDKIKSNQYDIISFDIWDTLIERPFIEPVHLFFLIENMEKAPGFAKKRISAEMYARSKLITPDADDITYADIYDYLPKNWQYLKDIETDLEIKYAKARPDLFEIYKLAQAQGKKILIASDMYLPTTVIEQILHNNGYTGYDKLYLSSELKKSKYSGTMYQLIKTDYPNAKILHIGDNKPADFDMANQHGFHGFHIEKSFDLVKHDKQEQRFIDYLKTMDPKLHSNNNPIFSAIYRMTNYYKLQHPQRDLKNSAVNIAINYYLPLATYYCFYIMSLLNDPKNPLQKAFFATRDCNILKLMFDQLWDGAEQSELFYTSRYLLSKYDQNNVRTLVAQAIDGKDISEKLCTMFNQQIADKLPQIIKEVNKTTRETHPWHISGEVYQQFSQLPGYNEIVKNYQQHVRQYLELTGVNKSENLIIDVGWSGGAQYSMLSCQLGLQTSFAYLLKIEHEQRLPNTYSMVNALNLYDRDHQYKFISQIESMFTYYTATVDRYSVENGQISFSYLDKPKSEQILRDNAKITEEITIEYSKWLCNHPLFSELIDDIAHKSNPQLDLEFRNFLITMVNKYDLPTDAVNKTVL